MVKNYAEEKSNVGQLSLPFVVKEDSQERSIPAKRVNIVSLKLVKESSIMYKERVVRSPEDGYDLLRQFLGDVD